jgi:F-type H+-transporting ATPase subunit alpha
MSLLLRRPPGREAYPGDVFYLHSRLLERSARLCDLKDEKGKVLKKRGSLTALPIIETQEGEVSAYIPTNVISITDGQIYLEPDLFFAGIRPAVNVGISVSRVGGKAQNKAMKQVAGSLRLDLASFAELEAFAQLGTELEPEAEAKIRRGRRMVELLKQGQGVPMPVEEQIAVLFAGASGLLDGVDLPRVGELERALLKHLREVHPEVLAGIREKREITPELEGMLKRTVGQFVQAFLGGATPDPRSAGQEPGMCEDPGPAPKGPHR